jgi:hypothetical protein
VLREGEGIAVIALIMLAMSFSDHGQKDRCSFALVLALAMVIVALGRLRVR